MISIDARNSLVLANQKLVYHCAKKYRHLPYFEDVLQEGRVGLIKAVNSLDSELTNFNFASYACKWIRGEILHYFRDKVDTIVTPRGFESISISSLNAITELGDELIDLIPSALPDSDLNSEKIDNLLKFSEYLDTKLRCVLLMTIDNYSVSDISLVIGESGQHVGAAKKRLCILARRYFKPDDSN